MKKFSLLTLLSFFSLSLQSQAHWKKSSSNPVLKQGSYGEWDYKGIEPSSVLYLDSSYHLWYSGDSSGVKRMGYARSPDGLNWTKYKDNPVLEPGPSGSWDESGVLCGQVLFQNEVYHMWYTGHNGLLEDKGYNIGLATSPDGIHWIKDANNPVLKKGPFWSWDGGSVSVGSVIYDGSRYQMWYEGFSGSIIAFTHSVGFGLATSPDGTTWIKSPQKPTLVPEQEAMDKPCIQAPSVLYDGTSYKMWYTNEISNTMQIAYASSEDGVKWTESKANPVLKTGPEGTWDDSSLGWPAVLDSAGIKYKMWYGASDDPNRLNNIGFAESDTRVPVLTMISEPLLDTTMILEVESSQDGSVYIVFPGTNMVADSIVRYKEASAHALAHTMTRISLTAVPPGSYDVTAISDNGCVCYKEIAIRIVYDLTPPALELEKETVESGESIVASSSKDGVLFLVKNSCPANISSIRSSRFLIDSASVTANVAVEFKSEGLEREVKLFALDKYRQLSESKTVHVGYSGINPSDAKEKWVSVYPNPVDKLVQIYVKKAGVYALRITSLSGQQILSLAWKGGLNEIDLSFMDPGVYLIQVDSEDCSWTGKLLKLQ